MKNIAIMNVKKSTALSFLLLTVAAHAGNYGDTFAYHSDERPAYFFGGAVAGGAMTIIIWKVVGSLYDNYSTKARVEREKKQRTDVINTALKKIKNIREKALNLEYSTFVSNCCTTREESSSYPTTAIVRPFTDYIYARASVGSKFAALQYGNLLESTIDSLDQSIESIKKAKNKEHYEIAMPDEELNSYIEHMLSFNGWLNKHKITYIAEFAETLRRESFDQENRDLVVEREKAEIERLKRESDLMSELQAHIASTAQLEKSLGLSLKKLTSIKRKVDDLQPSLAQAFSQWSMQSDIGQIKTDVGYIKGRLLGARI